MYDVWLPQSHIVSTTLRSTPCGRGGCGGHLAGRNAIGPVGKHRQRALPAETIESRAHLRATLTDLDSVIPRGDARGKCAERLGYLTGGAIAQLVAQLAAVLHLGDPVGLRPHAGRDAISLRTRTGELALVGHFDQGVPVVGRIDRGGLLWRGRGHRRQVHELAGLGVHRLRVRQPVPSDPQGIACARKIGHEVAAADRR